jgi:mannose-6-phosphate isomerase-like protein (cupin superfamily)
MSIVRRNGEEPVLRKKMFGGDGEAEMHVILNAPEEMFGKGRVFNRVVLRPGCEVAWHVHHGDGECYYILKGEGTYSDNGRVITMRPGDMSLVGDGEGHSMRNDGSEDLEMIALILYV